MPFARDRIAENIQRVQGKWNPVLLWFNLQWLGKDKLTLKIPPSQVSLAVSPPSALPHVMISISSCPSLLLTVSPSLGCKYKGAIDSFPHLESRGGENKPEWSGEGEIIVLRRHIYQYPSLSLHLSHTYSPFLLLFHCFVCKSSPTAEMQIFIFSRRGISQVTTKNRGKEE